MRIVITEEQLKTIFLESTDNSKKNILTEDSEYRKLKSVLDDKEYQVVEDTDWYHSACDRNTKSGEIQSERKGNCYYNEWTIPYWYTLKDPFDDGYDYQYKLYNNAQRLWVRRPIKDRGLGIDFAYGTADGFGKNGNEMFIDDPYSIKRGIPEWQKKLIEKLNKYKKLDIQSKKNKLDFEIEQYESLDNRIKIFNDTNKILKQYGWRTYDESQKNKFILANAGDIKFEMINQRGQEVMSDIQHFATYKYPDLSTINTDSRYIYSFSLRPGHSYGGNNRQKYFENLNAKSGDFANELKSRSMLKMVNDKGLPFGSFFVFANWIYGSTNMPRTKEEYKKQFGTIYLCNWLIYVYGTANPQQIKDSISKASQVNVFKSLNFPVGHNKLKEWKGKYHVQPYRKVRDPFSAVGDWMASWGAQDWIDAVSIVLYLIPTPLTWGIATGLELTNAGISLVKGNHGEAALRAGFLIGGALLSKAFSSTYKVSKESAEEVINIFQKVKGLDGDAARKVIEKEMKNSLPETAKFIDDLYTKNKGNMDKLLLDAKKNAEFMSKVDYYIRFGRMSEQKAVQKAGSETFGMSRFESMWRHIAPTTFGEGALMSIIYGSMQTLSYFKFKKQMEEIGIEEKKFLELLELMVNKTGGKTVGDAEKVAQNLTQSFVKQEMNYLLDKLPIYDNFTENCKQKIEPVAEFDVDPINQKINNGGITVLEGEGGPYDYKIYPDIDSVDSWGYVKGKDEKIWKKGNCETTKIMLKNYCKGNKKDIKTMEGRTCFVMLGGDPNINLLTAAYLDVVEGGVITTKKVDLTDKQLNMITSSLEGIEF